MKVLFFGTPAFAVESLDALVNSAHTVVGVVTQPDRALKHGKVEACPVKQAAEAHGIPVLQPSKIKTEAERLKAFGADIGVTAAYGQLLNNDVITAFPYGIINVHASLLPKYRGASPIQAAIADGERVTGVTIMKTELGLDTGDILSSRSTEIGDTETYGELAARLAAIGARLLVETLDNYASISPVKQDDALATHCRTITKEQQYIDFELDAKTIVDRIRSLSPVPCAKTVINGEVYKVYAVQASDYDTHATPGTVVCSDKRLTVACGKGCIDILTIQAPGKRVLGIAEFLRGKKLAEGVICAKPQQ